jgi:3alpha(or 20beta)-hydroxysteroid dehydrogenase
VTECSNEEWDRVIAVNQTGVFYGMRTVIPGMKQAGIGSIINISSQIGHTGGFEDELVAYVAAKTAVLGLTRNAALALGRYGIRANSISPGMVDTAMLGDPVRNKPFIERVPLRRVAQPLEVSHAVVYLASDESSYVTGADIMIDGGLETL